MGKFITCEGGDGCGKSTQLQWLYDAMFNARMDVVKTREPGGTKGGNAIRSLLVEGNLPWDGMTECLLHVAARRDHVQRLIKPRLAQDEWILCDRFLDSTMAYQAFGHGVDVAFINGLHQSAIEGLMPDLTLIFDIKPEDGLARARGRGTGEDRYEKMDIAFHQRLRDGFLQIAQDDKQRCVVINADDSIQNIHAQVIEVINRRFALQLQVVNG